MHRQRFSESGKVPVSTVQSTMCMYLGHNILLPIYRPQLQVYGQKCFLSSALCASELNVKCTFGGSFRKDNDQGMLNRAVVAETKKNCYQFLDLLYFCICFDLNRITKDLSGH